MDNIEKDNIFNKFCNGKSVDSLAKEYSMARSKIYQIIDGRLPCVKHLSKDEEMFIVDSYISGMSSMKIGEELKIGHKLVNKILDKHGINRKHNGVRKWTLNEHYFDCIDSQNKAYILGLLYADGYNGMDKSTIRLQLQDCDVDILKLINEELNSNRPLRFINCSSRVASNGYISKDMYSLEVFSSYMCKTLNNIGVTQNKSLSLTFPIISDRSLYRHFIRGYFDGDGSFCYSNKNASKRYQGLITITSTASFCEDCLDILRQDLNIGGSIFDASCHNGITKVLTISGNRQCKKVLDWLYVDADLYLKRKYEKYLKAYYPVVA